MKEGSIGQPLPGTIVSLRDLADPTKEVPVGEKGEICIKGPQVMKGYWKRPEETAEQMVGEFLRTGDVGIMDEEGFFFIVDRIKDLIICSGYNVYPRRIEEAIYEHPGGRGGDGDRHQGQVARRGAQGLRQAQARRAAPPRTTSASTWSRKHLQDRDAGRDRVPRRAAQDHDRQAVEEGAEGRGGRKRR